MSFAGFPWIIRNPPPTITRQIAAVVKLGNPGTTMDRGPTYRLGNRRPDTRNETFLIYLRRSLVHCFLQLASFTPPVGRGVTAV
jgi:hypothetical protein